MRRKLNRREERKTKGKRDERKMVEYRKRNSRGREVRAQETMVHIQRYRQEGEERNES